MTIQERFIEQVEAMAVQLWKKFGVLPSVAIAQGALESNWGRSGLATKYNNLFGIKGSYNGDTAMMDTWEVYDGKRVEVRDGFRVYPNWSTSMYDYGLFLNVNKRYADAIGLKDYKEQITAIHKAGYATDPDYAKKIIQIIEDNQLYLYDEIVLEVQKILPPIEQQMIDLTNEVNKLKEKMSLPEIPSWAKEAVEFYSTGDKPLVANPNNSSYDFYRLLTVMYRAGIGR